MASHVISSIRSNEVITTTHRRSMTHSITLLLTILCAIACLPQIDGFTAGQPAPWIPPLNDNPNLKLNDVYILRRPSKKHSSAVSTADADSLDVAEDLADEDGIGDGPTSQVQDVSSRVNVQDIPRTVASISTRPPSTPEAATILSSIGPLLKMTRPGNLVGVVCFYVSFLSLVLDGYTDCRLLLYISLSNFARFVLYYCSTFFLFVTRIVYSFWVFIAPFVVLT